MYNAFDFSINYLPHMYMWLLNQVFQWYIEHNILQHSHKIKELQHYARLNFNFFNSNELVIFRTTKEFARFYVLFQIIQT